jgi:hypothetical protein
MKNLACLLVLTIFVSGFHLKAQNSEDYIEFDDRKNVVHGVYLGLNFLYGEIDGESAYMGGAKVAYVANQKFEVGFAGVGFYTEQSSEGPVDSHDVYGGYGGLHLEPIFFGDSMFSVSIPMLIGGGAAGHSSDFDDYYVENWDPFFVFEPGVSLLYNVSSYLQFEIGVKYRWTSDIDLYPDGPENLNGFSGGIGLKIGVFNLGKNK